jgi:hypothetical protein
MSVQEFVAKMCKGSIHGELPKEFLGYSIKELMAAKRNGLAGADTCLKLLRQDRFRKPGKY